MLVVCSNDYNLQFRIQARIQVRFKPQAEATLLVSVPPAMALWLLDGEGVLPALILEIPTWCEQGIN